MTDYRLTHLQQLEAESIHIMREVVAEFENPVMLYSIGKDSSVMVRLAQKAFAPGQLPFPLLHVNTTWKFQEMIAFRDRFCADNGFRLLSRPAPWHATSPRRGVRRRRRRRTHAVSRPAAKPGFS